MLAEDMKEGGDWSSERRGPHGSIKFDGRSVIPDWASLPPELVEGVADRVLSTDGGVGAYMDMRAACSTWRSAIAKPSPLAAVADLRFRPRHWVMVDLKSRNHGDDDARLFLHVPTGRFRRLRLPVLRDHIVLGASDGLIVLGDREHPHLARVLNPLSGDMLHFAVPLLQDLESADELYTAVSSGHQSTLFVWRDCMFRWNKVLYADPTSAEFTQEDINTTFLTSMVTFQGNIYVAGVEGSVFRFVRPAEQYDYDHELVAIAQMSPNKKVDNSTSSYLVESAGELLLVLHRDEALKVLRVDVKRKLMEDVKSIGCHTLFLGDGRCLSVDANMLPSVDADCIYMSDWLETSEYPGYYTHTYNLRDGSMEILSSEPMLRANIHPRAVIHPKQTSPNEDSWDNNHRLSPLSLIQVLLRYCNGRTFFYD